MTHDQQPLQKVRHGPGVPGKGLAGVTRQHDIKLRRSLYFPVTADPSAVSVYLAPGSHVNAAREQCPAPQETWLGAEDGGGKRG